MISKIPDSIIASKIQNTIGANEEVGLQRVKWQCSSGDHIVTKYSRKQTEKEGRVVFKQIDALANPEKVEKALKKGVIVIVVLDRVKMEGEHADSLKYRGFTRGIIKDVGGNVVHEIHNLKIETMTKAESEQLRRAITQLLVAVYKKRKEEEGHSHKTKETDFPSTPSTSHSDHHEIHKLKPSDFLLMVKGNEAAVLKFLIEVDRREQEKQRKNTQRDDDEAQRIKDEVLRNDNLKRDIKTKEIKKERGS